MELIKSVIWTDFGCRTPAGGLVQNVHFTIQAPTSKRTGEVIWQSFGEVNREMSA